MQPYRYYKYFLLFVLLGLGFTINSLAQYSTVEVIKSGEAPGAFSSINPASGGSGGFTYLWQDSIKGSVWSAAPGVNNNLNYQSPILNDTTYYRRLATNFCGTASSDILTIYTLDPAGALRFDDFDQVVVPNNPNLIPDLSSFTIEFWIKTHYNSITPSYYDIVLGMYDNGSYELAFSASDYLTFTLTDVANVSQSINSVSPLTDDEWHHVAVVRDVANNNLSMYVDGILENTASLTTTGAISPTSPLYLGANNGSFPSKIIMDELRIWNKASTASEILNNMLCELDGNETQLMAYYDFNSGMVNGNNYSDTILYDRTSNNNNGILDDFYLNGDSSNWVVGNDSIDVLCSVLNGPLTATLNIDTAISCFGESDGTISVQAYGGVPPYTFLWNNSSTNTSITGLNSRIYSVTVTDAASSFTVEEITLMNPPQLSVSENVINTTCNSASDGSISLNASGGTGAYIYLWSDNSTSPNKNTLVSGTYFFTVTDANNCLYSDSAVVLYGSPYQPQITSSTTFLCTGDTITLGVDTSGTGYCWYTSASRFAQWKVVGNAGFTSPSIREHSMALHPFTNEPYVAFGDNSYSGATTVMKFDGTNWVFVGSPGFTPGSSENQSLAFHPLTGEPYLVFKDNLNSNSTTVMKFDGSSWNIVGSPAISTTSSEHQNIAFNPLTFEPYVIFKDNFNGDRTTVKKFDGTSWINVGIPGFSPSSADYQKITFNPLTNEPYVAFSDNGNSGKTLVMKFNGTNWVNVGTTGFSPGSALYLSLDFHPTTGEPYVAFQDKTNSDKTTVMKYNGSNWVYVGVAGFTPGAALYQSLDFHPTTHEPYVAFRDKLNSDKTSVMRYDGSSWSMVGSAGFSPAAAEQQNLAFNLATNEAYVSFLDKFNSDKVTVMKYALTCDGNSSTYAVTTPGTYYVDVTYSNGCISTSDSIVITGDTMAPVVVTNDIYIYLDINGQAIVNVASINNGSYDNCAIDTMYLSQTTFNCSDLGANQVILTVVDTENNISTDTAIVTVEDYIPPTAAAYPLTVYLDSTGNVVVDPFQVDNGSSDNCGILNYILADTTFDCSNIGLNRVRYTVEDSTFNSSSVTVSITVTDSLAPFISTTPDTFYLNSASSTIISFADIDNGTVDNCQLDTVLVSPNSFNCSNVGWQSITILATDIYNNSSSSIDSVFIADTILPIALAKDTTIYLDASGNVTIDSSFIDNGSTDNCQIANFTLDSTNFDCSEIGRNTVVMTVEDSHGNISTATSIVTVIDSTPPTAITNSASVYLNNLGYVAIDSSTIDNGSYDNCGIVNFYLSKDTFNCADLGIQTINYTILDLYGNVTTGSETITVMDTTSPNVALMDTTVYLDINGTVSIDSSFIDAGSNDNCGIASITLSQSTFTCNDEGVNTINVIVEDSYGNISNGTVNVTVLDTISPIALAKDTSIFLDASGNVTIDSSFIDNGSTDNCQIANITLDSTNFDCSEIGRNTVVMTVEDSHGNISTATSIVTVIDSTPPTAITNSASVYLNNLGYVAIDSSTIDNGSYDNCGIVNFYLSKDTFNCADLGIQTINYTILDLYGNVTTGSETITVMDTTSPNVALMDTTVYLDINGTVSIDSSFIDAGSNDNCGIASITLSQSTFTCNDEGVNTINVTVEDSYGNISNGTVDVTVLDTISPIALAKDTSIYLDASGNVTIDSSFIDNGSTDNCQIASITLSSASFSCIDVGLNSITMTVWDEFGNSNTASSTVTVIDSIKPTAITQSSTVYLNSNGYAAIDSSIIDNGSFDNCGIQSLVISPNLVYCNQDTVLLNYTLTDLNGNSVNGTETVYVLDTISPLAVLKDTTVYLNSNGTITIDSSYVEVYSTDNCGISNISLNQTSFDCSDEGYNQVAVSVMDSSGNITQQNVNVIVRDSLSPIALTQDTVVYLDANGQFTIDSSYIDNQSTDNCDIQSITLDRYTFNCSDVNQANSVIMSVTDEFNNSSTSTATVQVLDSISPVILTNNITVYLDANGTAVIDSSDIDNGSYDNCGIARMVLAQTIFDCSHIGNNSVLFTVTDVNQNSSMQTFTVNVMDTIAPIINNCPGNITVNVDAGTCGANVQWSAPNALDNCSIDSLVSNINPNTFFPVGITTVSYIAYNGVNTDTCIFSVTVLDNEKPVISNCPSDISVSNDPGECFASVTWTLPSAIDNCRLDSLVSNYNSGDDFPIGITEVMYVAYDSLNTDTCTFTITVTDTEAPVLTCISDTSICDPVFNYNMPSLTDNCSSATLTQLSGLPSGATFPIGATTNTFVAIDQEGNTDTCSFEVLVRALPLQANAGVNQSICADTAQLSAVTPNIGSGTWSVITGNAIFNDPSDPNSILRGLSVGLNEFEWNVSNEGCGLTKDTVEIHRDQLAMGLNAGVDEVLCSEFEYELNAVPISFGSGIWSVISGSGNISITNNEQTMVNNLSLGENIFQWSISNGVCPVVSDTVTIIVDEIPLVDAGNDITIFNGEETRLNAITNYQGANYNWSPSFSLDNANIANPLASPTETTTYRVETRSMYDCMSFDEVIVFVNQQLEIATGLTPNNDGRNDVWIIKNIHKYPSVEIQVFSRSGQKVFSSTGYNEEWDGTYNGNELPTDSYYYVIQLNDEDNKVFEGTVTIIR